MEIPTCLECHKSGIPEREDGNIKIHYDNKLGLHFIRYRCPTKGCSRRREIIKDTIIKKVFELSTE